MKDSEKRTLKDSRIRNVTLTVAIFVWVVSVVLGCFAGAGMLDSQALLLAVWGAFSATVALLACIVNFANAKRSKESLLRETLAEELEKTETLEIMQAICSNYNAVYYLNCLTEEVKFIQIGKRIRTSMPDEFISKHPVEWYIKTYAERLVPEEYREDFIKNVNPELIRNKLKDREFYTYDYIGDKNGEQAYFQMRAARVNGSENHIVLGFADVDAEVREVESRERMLREALVSVENANRTKTEFLSKISGDLKSPLNVIASSASKIEADTGASENVKEEVRQILLESDNLEIMINDMLDLGAMQEGNLFFEKRPFDINKALDEVLVLSGKRADNKDINIDCSRQVVHDTVIGDAQKFVDMLKHIFYNAIECSKDGGEIRVTLVETQVLKDRAYFDISVEDFGTSLSTMDIEGIYSDDTKAGGAAVGLSTTRIITEMLGGKFEITSKQRGGNLVRMLINFEIGK